MFRLRFYLAYQDGWLKPCPLGRDKQGFRLKRFRSQSLGAPGVEGLGVRGRAAGLGLQGLGVQEGLGFRVKGFEISVHRLGVWGVEEKFSSPNP